MRSLSRIVLPCFLVAACGPYDPNAAPVSSAITAGTPAPNDSAVVVLIIESAAGYDLCSGTVVSPHVVLTAAHCVDPNHVGSGVTFVVSDLAKLPMLSRPPSGAHYFTVKETRAHPSYVDAATTAAAMQGDASQPFHDVGVVITDQPLPITPLPMNYLALDDGSVGAALRDVGYGETVASDWNTIGVRSQAPVTLQALYPDLFFLAGDTQNVCRGDSGGPALLVQDGREVIAGVHSWIPHGDSCTGGQYDTRIDQYATSFVEPFIDANDPGFLPQPDLGPTEASTPDAMTATGCSVGAARRTSSEFVIALALAAFARSVSRRRRSIMHSTIGRSHLAAEPCDQTRLTRDVRARPRRARARSLP